MYVRLHIWADMFQFHSCSERNKIDRKENNVVMENEESITINSDDENSNIGRHVPQIDSDDVMMITPTKTPSKGHLDNMTIDSPMKIDSEDISSHQLSTGSHQRSTCIRRNK
jgi:hypothetical protein